VRSLGQLAQPRHRADPDPVRRLGPGHYISSGVNFPIRGNWNLTIRILFSETDQAALAGKLPIG
jgi:hypothetical protein